MNAMPGIRRSSAIAAILICTFAAVAGAGERPCDRECLRNLADGLLSGMTTHTVRAVPLAGEYSATENGRPAALPMMTIWRTVTAVRNRHFFIDDENGQIFLIAGVTESSGESLLFGRLKARGDRLEEIELYIDRSRGDGGFMFDPNGPASFPAAWTRQLQPAQRASRADLLQAGRSIFNSGIASPKPASSCVLMENGRIVGEDPEVLKSIAPGMDISRLQRHPDGSVAIPCGTPPDRPNDPLARTDIIDTVQGVAISIGVVDGVVQPYLATNPTESAYVPRSLLQPYVAMLGKQRAAAVTATPSLRPMPASQLVVELYRIFDGQLQGMMMLQHTMPSGAGTPWVARPAGGQ